MSVHGSFFLCPPPGLVLESLAERKPLAPLWGTRLPPLPFPSPLSKLRDHHARSCVPEQVRWHRVNPQHPNPRTPLSICGQACEQLPDMPRLWGPRRGFCRKSLLLVMTTWLCVRAQMRGSILAPGHSSTASARSQVRSPAQPICQRVVQAVGPWGSPVKRPKENLIEFEPQSLQPQREGQE